MIFIDCGDGDPENYSEELATKIQEILDNTKEVDNK